MKPTFSWVVLLGRKNNAKKRTMITIVLHSVPDWFNKNPFARFNSLSSLSYSFFIETLPRRTKLRTFFLIVHTLSTKLQSLKKPTQQLPQPRVCLCFVFGKQLVVLPRIITEFLHGCKHHDGGFTLDEIDEIHMYTSQSRTSFRLTRLFRLLQRSQPFVHGGQIIGTGNDLANRSLSSLLFLYVALALHVFLIFLLRVEPSGSTESAANVAVQELSTIVFLGLSVNLELVRVVKRYLADVARVRVRG